MEPTHTLKTPYIYIHTRFTVSLRGFLKFAFEADVIIVGMINSARTQYPALAKRVWWARLLTWTQRGYDLIWEAVQGLEVINVDEVIRDGRWREPHQLSIGWQTHGYCDYGRSWPLDAVCLRQRFKGADVWFTISHYHHQVGHICGKEMGGGGGGGGDNISF